MALIVLSGLADADFEEIIADLAAVAGWRTAVKYDRAFDSLYVRLAEHPEIGARRPRLGRGIRIGIVPPYIVPYRYDRASDTVTVPRLVHGRRRISRGLLRGAD
jgi:toxin ParE1/3/4